MNYLILDTEQTYNYGYIVINEKGEVLLRKNIVITNNFENRKLIGENTYKRKKPIYEKDPNAIFINSAEGAALIAKDLRDYNIEQIISHNISEDRRQVELLTTQTGISFPEIPFYDSITLIKVLFPNNTQTNLEAIMSDITGIDVKQTHTALQDCELLYSLIGPIIKYLPYFIKYQEIFAHDSDYEITHLVFTNLNNILPLPKNIKLIQNILQMDGNIGDKRRVSNFFKSTSESYHFWEIVECIEYSEKTKAPLKTPGNEVRVGANFTDATTIGVLFTSLDKIAETICSNCVTYQASQETNEMINEKIKTYLDNFETTLAAKELELERAYSQKETELETQRKEFEAQIIDERKALSQKELELERATVNMIIQKIGPIVKGGIFNFKAKKVKKLVKSCDVQGLYNYFMNN